MDPMTAVGWKAVEITLTLAITAAAGWFGRAVFLRRKLGSVRKALDARIDALASELASYRQSHAAAHNGLDQALIGRFHELTTQIADASSDYAREAVVARALDQLREQCRELGTAVGRLEGAIEILAGSSQAVIRMRR